jgi:signal transduction histidine kinase
MVNPHASPGASRPSSRKGGGVDSTLKSVIEALDLPIAVLDASGNVLAVNGAWAVAPEGCDRRSACLVGDNYLDWCETLGPRTAGSSLANGARRVLAGMRPAYSQTARIAPTGGGREVQVRIRRLGRASRRLCLVAHEPAAVSDEFEDRLLSAQLEERERLAAELHDSVGQSLVCLGLGLTRLRRLTQSSAELEPVVADMEQALQQAHAEIRTLSFLLLPPWLDEPGAFVNAVRDLVTGFASRSGLRVTVEVAPVPRDLTEARELALFRTLQEALVNIHRHAHAEVVEVVLGHRGKSVFLKVRDDGCGMTAPEGVAPHPGVGLVSMRARLRKFGGDLRIVSGHDGTTLTARVPA